MKKPQPSLKVWPWQTTEPIEKPYSCLIALQQIVSRRELPCLGSWQERLARTARSASRCKDQIKFNECVGRQCCHIARSSQRIASYGPTNPDGHGSGRGARPTLLPKRSICSAAGATDCPRGSDQQSGSVHFFRCEQRENTRWHCDDHQARDCYGLRQYRPFGGDETCSQGPPPGQQRSLQ